MRLRLASLTLALSAPLGALAGCGPAASEAPAPPAMGLQLATGEYTLAAGKEDYGCFVKTLTAAEAGDINRFEIFAGTSIHHLALFKTTAPEPEGYAPCSPITKLDWIPLYSGGVGTKGLTLPGGAATRLEAGDHLLVHLHQLNAAPAPVTDRVFVNLHYVPPGTAVKPAGIFAVGSMKVDIPAGARDATLSASCNVERKLDVFAVFPHMHKSAKKIVLEHGPSADQAKVVYKLDPWVFADQPMDPLELSVSKGDFLRVTCSYDNLTGKPLTYGESMDNEMCYGILFYTPFDRLDGCVEFK